MNQRQLDITRRNLQVFLDQLTSKYLSGTPYTMKAKAHFVERLSRDRSEHFEAIDVSKLLSKIFQERLVEFLYCGILSRTEGAVFRVLFTKGTLGVVFEDNNEIAFTTIFKGNMLRDDTEYTFLEISGG